MHCSLHYSASKKWNPVGTEDTLLSGNCYKQKRTELKVSRLWAITFSFWMSVGPSTKGLVWTRTLHWTLTTQTVYSSLKWALLLPEETHDVHGNVGWGCWQALLRAAKACPMEGDSMWPRAWELPMGEHLKAERSWAIYQALGFSPLAKTGK